MASFDKSQPPRGLIDFDIFLDNGIEVQQFRLAVQSLIQVRSKYRECDSNLVVIGDSDGSRHGEFADKCIDVQNASLAFVDTDRAIVHDRNGEQAERVPVLLKRGHFIYFKKRIPAKRLQEIAVKPVVIEGGIVVDPSTEVPQ